MSHILGALGHMLGPLIDGLLATIAWLLALVGHVVLSAVMMAVQWFVDLPLWQQFVVYLIGAIGVGIPGSSDEEKPWGSNALEWVQGIETDEGDWGDLDAVIGKILGYVVLYPLVGWVRLLHLVGGVLKWVGSWVRERAQESELVSFSLLSGDVVSFSFSGILSKLLRR